MDPRVAKRSVATDPNPVVLSIEQDALSGDRVWVEADAVGRDLGPNAGADHLDQLGLPTPFPSSRAERPRSRPTPRSLPPPSTASDPSLPGRDLSASVRPSVVTLTARW